MSYQGESGWPSCLDCGHAHPDGRCERFVWGKKPDEKCGCESYKTTRYPSIAPDGERVTTGSEPRRWPDRRWRIFKSRPDSPTPGEYVEGPPTGGPIEVREVVEATAVSNSRAWTLAPDSTDDPPLPYACEGPMLRPDERVRVVEVVESGHDEQTECPVCKGHGGPGPLDPCPECNKYGPLWQPDPRTVAAVVEEVDRWYHGKPPIHKPLLEHLAERFNPSAPGGGNGH